MGLVFLCSVFSVGVSAKVLNPRPFEPTTTPMPGTAPVPVTPSLESKNAIPSAREPASDYPVISPDAPPRPLFDVGNLKFDLTFSHAIIEATSNDTGRFATDTLNPGIAMGWNYYRGPGFELTLTGALEHKPYRTNSLTDLFHASSPWLWTLGANNRVYFDSDFSLSADVQVKRRIFALRRSISELAGDSGIIPQVGVSARYRLAKTGPGMGAYLSAGGSYLLPSATQYSSTKAGYAITGEFRLERDLFGTPWAFGINVERAHQNTNATDASFWNLGFLVGIQIGPSEEVR